MEGFDPATSFGADVARCYDNRPRGDEAETVDVLAALAGDGPALEFAIGTGRIALPLVERGVPVDGIELSPDMVARLREKSGGSDIAVVMGDMSKVTTGSRYRLVYLVFNTIGNLLTQDDQVACFENATRHLTDDGVFVVEIQVPAPRRQFVNAELVATDEVVIDVNRYDPVTQILDENHVTLTNEGVRRRADLAAPRVPERARPDGVHRRPPAS